MTVAHPRWPHGLQSKPRAGLRSMKCKRLKSIRHANDIHAALYPERYDNPRRWNRVPWPQRHIAFDCWFARTRLAQAIAARGAP